MTIHKKGQAHWEGDIKRGKGTVSTESGVLNQQPYGFNTRFEGEKGTNPEELISACRMFLNGAFINAGGSGIHANID